MGTAVFTPCSGAVEIKRDCPSNQALSIFIGSGRVDGIITGMTLEMSGNYQFLHTVNDFVYFYAFGDRVGTLTLTGLGFMTACPGSSKGGILKLYDYYMSNRAIKRGGKALRVVISGGQPSASIKLWGFLTGMRMDIADSQMGTVGYWTLRFEVLPRPSSFFESLFGI